MLTRAETLCHMFRLRGPFPGPGKRSKGLGNIAFFSAIAIKLRHQPAFFVINHRCNTRLYACLCEGGIVNTGDRPFAQVRFEHLAHGGLW